MLFTLNFNCWKVYLSQTVLALWQCMQMEMLRGSLDYRRGFATYSAQPFFSFPLPFYFLWLMLPFKFSLQIPYLDSRWLWGMGYIKGTCTCVICHNTIFSCSDYSCLWRHAASKLFLWFFPTTWLSLSAFIYHIEKGKTFRFWYSLVDKVSILILIFFYHSSLFLSLTPPPPFPSSGISTSIKRRVVKISHSQ